MNGVDLEGMSHHPRVWQPCYNHVLSGEFVAYLNGGPTKARQTKQMISLAIPI